MEKLTMKNTATAANPDLKRYDLFGWDYEIHSPLDEREVAWHEAWAKRAGGPLLGLACGTGRLPCRLAEAGFDVTGLDLSHTMLQFARKNIARLPTTARKRIRLVQADMASFDLDRQFGLIFIADNSFREQKTRRELLSCLRHIRRHLQPGGKLLITERRLDRSRFTGRLRTFGWSDPIADPRTGESVSRRGEVRLSRDGRRASGKFVYKITRADGSETIEECPWSAPMLQKREYLALFDRAGFRTQTFADYRETADDGKAPILCFVCTARK